MNIVQKILNAHIENLKWTKDIVYDTSDSLDRRLERSIENAEKVRDRNNQQAP